MKLSPKPLARLLPGVLGLAAVAGIAIGESACGGGSSRPKLITPPGVSEAQFRREVAAAQAVNAAAFPAAQGRTLQQLAQLTRPGLQLAFATMSLSPGRDRLAFGLIDPNGRFFYAPSVAYVGATPNGPARGPYLAPIDPFVVPPAFRSQNAAADPNATAAVYSTRAPLPRPGRYAVLVVTKTANGLLGSTSAVQVTAHSAIPAVGQRPPPIATDTLTSVGGNVGKLTTRVPPDDMNKVSFSDVLGKRPVALLFSTPALCQSRVCGPVTDLALALQAQYRGRVTFIHEEVYRDNRPPALRPALQAFHLKTEPWLFTIDRHGRIAARLEGAFGITEFRAAVEAALRA